MIAARGLSKAYGLSPKQAEALLALVGREEVRPAAVAASRHTLTMGP